jgi:alkanesulfonate monooxygenase SsuD/methylene tetrahydromethanopterin reductase-like flavin-dependent oxidoreductase (luciferase family)
VTLEFMIWDHVTRPAGEGLGELYRHRIELVQRAEAAGFSHYHVAEHHGHVLSMAPSQFVYLAAVARETGTIGLGTMVTCLPLHHPIRLAEEICMLDQLSDGRLEWGFGKGISPFEHRFFGHDPAEAAARSDDMLPTILEALETGVMRSEGSKYFSFPDADLAMEPRQRPYPELWYPANLTYAAEHNLHLVMPAFVTPEQRSTFDELVAANGANPARMNPQVEKPRLGSTHFVLVTEHEEDAVRLGAEATTSYTGLIHRSGGFEPPHIQAARPPDAETSDPRRHQSTPGRSFDTRFLAGTPEQIRDRLVPYVAGVRLDFISMGFFPGTLPLEVTRRSVELFIDEVLPALREAAV